jgi:pimeloyl-ACP methyl ester carboxylesterase
VSGLQGAATRRDGEVREEAGWRGSPGDRVFVVRHLPPTPRAGVVVCSPIGGEGDSNYRREVLLSRALARQGIAVQRWHWRGTGNSDGDPAKLTFATMVDDAARAVDDMADLVGGPVVVFGTRLSGYVAGEVAARGRGLCLWHPPPTGDAYFRELGRLLRMNKLAQAAGRSLDAPRSLGQELDADGVSEIGGYQVHRAYHASMAGRALAEVVPAAGTDVLVVQFGGSSLPTSVQEQVDTWAAGDCDVTVRLLDDSEAWWFAPDDSAEDRRPVTVAAVAATVEWCTSLVEGTTALESAPATASPGSVAETTAAPGEPAAPVAPAATEVAP